MNGILFDKINVANFYPLKIKRLSFREKKRWSSEVLLWFLICDIPKKIMQNDPLKCPPKYLTEMWQVNMAA